MPEQFDLLLILDPGGGPVVEYTFHDDGLAMDSGLLGGFISAIHTFSSNFVNKDDALDRIAMGSMQIVFVLAETVMGVLVGENIEDLTRQKIFNVIDTFEKRYADTVGKQAYSVTRYEPFTAEIPHLFSMEPVAPYVIPHSIFPTDADHPAEFQSVAGFIDNSTTALEISDIMKRPFYEVGCIIRRMIDAGLVETSFSPSLNDLMIQLPSSVRVVTRSDLSYYTFLSEQGEEVYELLQKIDGRSFLGEITDLQGPALRQILEPLLRSNLVRIAKSWEKELIEGERFQEEIFAVMEREFRSNRLEQVGLSLMEKIPNQLHSLIDPETGGLEFEKVRIYVFPTSEKEAGSVVDIVKVFCSLLNEALGEHYAKRRAKRFFRTLRKRVNVNNSVAHQVLAFLNY